MFIANQVPRPYKVTFKLPNGELVSDTVMAFDLSEAMMQGSLSMTVKGYGKIDIFSVGPDEAAIAAKQKEQQQNAAADFVSTLFKKLNTDKDDKKK